jgi:hypothetical protein
MDRRSAMEAMVRLTHERCPSPSSPVPVRMLVQRAPSPAMYSRDDVILSLKRAHLKIQKSRGLDASHSAEADPTVLPHLCSVVGQIPLHPPPLRSKSPTTPITINRNKKRVVIKEPIALHSSPSSVEDSIQLPKPFSTLHCDQQQVARSSVAPEPLDQFASADIELQLAGSLLGRPDIGAMGGHTCSTNYDSPRADDREHERILKKAGYINAMDFDNDDERELAVAHAKKIANRRALHRSLHTHQPQLPPSSESSHEFATHTSTPPRKHRTGGAQSLTPPPSGTSVSRHQYTLANALSKYSSSRRDFRSVTSPLSHMKRGAGMDNDHQRGGKQGRTLSPIPMPTSELVNRTLTMLEGIDSLSLTTTGGNCFRLTSDIQFSLKGSFR